MNHNTFTTYMHASKTLSSPRYYQGYHYGLRRHYHGDNFGDNGIIKKMKSFGDEMTEGINDGLEGKRPKIDEN